MFTFRKTPEQQLADLHRQRERAVRDLTKARGELLKRSSQRVIKADADFIATLKGRVDVAESNVKSIDSAIEALEA